MNLKDLDYFVASYIECMLWSSTVTDESDPMYGTNFDEVEAEIGPEDMEEIRRECKSFIKENLEDLADLDSAQCGHDFWLTRNHHGAGFWDRGYGEVGDRLTDAAHSYGSAHLWLGGDNLIHVEDG